MKIDILNDVIGKEYPVSQIISLDKAELNTREIISIGDCKVQGFYLLESQDYVLVNLNIKTKIQVYCDNCLNETEIKINTDFERAFSKEKDENANLYTGSVIDLLDIIYEQILFIMPPKVLCREDCKGLCCVCGCNLNQSKCDCNIKEQRINPFAILKQLEEDKNGITKK